MPDGEARSRAGAPVLVFDLDGTILRGNSFPAWVVFLAIGRVRGLGPAARLRLSFAVQRRLLGRKLGRSAHDQLLRELQGVWAGAGARPEAAARFEAALLRQVRPCLRPMLALVEAGADAVLATAAAAEYAEALGRRLGFRHVLTTPSGAACNLGARKRDRVLALVRAQGWQGRPIVFLTDHRDDLPLILHSDVVCWFGSAAMLAEARAAAPAVRFVDCRGYDAAAMAALLPRLGLGRAAAPASTAA